VPEAQRNANTQKVCVANQLAVEVLCGQKKFDLTFHFIRLLFGCALHRPGDFCIKPKYRRMLFMKKRLAALIPSFLNPLLKRLYYIPADIGDKLKDRKDMIPPSSMIFVGVGDFEKTGEEFLNYFTQIANLQPNSRVLDVGCGIGRMAVPLTTYLSKHGEYWGFDIVEKGIQWCQENITSKFSNFHFIHSDIYNKFYNRNGKFNSQDYRFPFDNDFFDFIFLTSVFTHMLPSDIRHYMGEISRVLKPGGNCLITFFILNEESKMLVTSGSSTLNFQYQVDDFLTINETVPEDAVAYEEEFVKKLFENHGLGLKQPIHYGAWCGRQNFLTYQDLIIAEKTNSGVFSSEKIA
jgi:ubiquinone/menaquinone biosynthesis C-methylase UbiE